MGKVIETVKGIKIIGSIVILCVVSLVTIVLTALIGLNNNIGQQNRINEITEDVIPLLVSWGEINGEIGVMRNTLTKIIDRDYDQAMVDDLLKNHQSIYAKIAANLEKAEENSEELELANRVMSSYQKYYSYIPDVIEQRKRGVELDQQLAFVEMANAGNELTQSIIDVVDYKENYSSQLSNYAKERYREGLQLTLGIFTVALVVMIFLSLIIIIGIRSSIQDFTSNLNILAKGDFTVKFNEKMKNEFGIMNRALNKTLDTISSSLRLIEADSEKLSKQTVLLSSSSGIINTTVNEVSLAIQGVAEGSTSQAEELMQINEMFNNLSQHLEEINESVAMVDQTTNTIGITAENSSSELNQLVTTVNEVEVSFSDSRNKISNLIASISKVTEITKFISEIAQQTNLLSLNASIEAARAGEAGSGFAVVATEIRNLASQVSVSSEGINKMMYTINEEIRVVSETTENTSLILQDQVNMVNSTIESLTSIIGSIQLIIPQIDGITSSIQNLNEGKSKMLLTVESASAVSEENSASAEEISASTVELVASYNEISKSIQELEHLIKETNEAISIFKLS
ncbi:methyl-accepting chemotaxis protein [Paenibacillus lentus]|uniref:Methyl-accepting chemotaxis protein n=1 Tax=Paenibacillus lentus TaxID=1338368 RepID=A0A3Q8SB49_9BACL|nr:methyl-accepting chemotaxis protein [Paenibacillus lentus]AZK46642.1 methyl-accepting chemotaxis protein [Paenibacillus lentus]